MILMSEGSRYEGQQECVYAHADGKIYRTFTVWKRGRRVHVVSEMRYHDQEHWVDVKREAGEDLDRDVAEEIAAGLHHA